MRITYTGPPSYIGPEGLRQVIEEGTIPEHLPVEQLNTLRADNPDALHSAHLNAGLLYAALELNNTPEGQALVRQYTLFGLIEKGKLALQQVVKLDMEESA